MPSSCLMSAVAAISACFVPVCAGQEVPPQREEYLVLSPFTLRHAGPVDPIAADLERSVQEWMKSYIAKNGLADADWSGGGLELSFTGLTVYATGPNTAIDAQGNRSRHRDTDNITVWKQRGMAWEQTQVTLDGEPWLQRLSDNYIVVTSGNGRAVSVVDVATGASVPLPTGQYHLTLGNSGRCIGYSGDQLTAGRIVDGKYESIALKGIEGIGEMNWDCTWVAWLHDERIAVLGWGPIIDFEKQTISPHAPGGPAAFGNAVIGNDVMIVEPEGGGYALKRYLSVDHVETVGVRWDVKSSDRLAWISPLGRHVAGRGKAPLLAALASAADPIVVRRIHQIGDEPTGAKRLKVRGDDWPLGWVVISK